MPIFNYICVFRNCLYVIIVTMIRNCLTEVQKDQVRTWLRAGYTVAQVIGLAKNAGFTISEENIRMRYLPQVRKDFAEHIAHNELKNSWFNKEFRAERAAMIADKLFGDIMEGKMYGEEVSEREDRNGNTIVQTKPVYFAGMIKNWKDLVDTIANELGQRKQQVDVNFNKNQNLNLSVLVEKIYEQDNQMDRKLEGAEIIDLPSNEDFADDKGFMAIVGPQPDEIKEVVDTEDHGDDLL